MTKRIYALLVLLFCATTFTFAQNSLDVPSYEGSASMQDEESSDLSDNYFPPKPKHGTEIGLNLGYNFIHGDVYTRPGFGVGLHVRRAINYTISWRVQAAYGQAYGMDDRLTNFSNDEGSSVAGGIQVTRSTVSPYMNQGGRYYRNYKTENIWGSAHIIANVSNILFHKKSNKWNLYAFAGPSLYYYNGSVNLFDENGNAYRDLNGNPGFEQIRDTNDDKWWRQDKLKEIRDFLDDSYETEILYYDARTSNNVPGQVVPGQRHHLNLLRSNKASIMPAVDFGLGVARKFGKRFNIAIEHQAAISVNDNLDGYDPQIHSNRNVDIPHYTNLKLNFNILPKDGVEPLYWVNPLRPSMEDIARLKRDQFTLKDADGDGVVDEFDEEPDTPEGCLVDTRGRSLDSDGDGVVDCEDAEPYTPYNLVDQVDDKGVAPEVEMPEPGLTRDEILALGGQQGWDKKCEGCGGTTVVPSGCSDWFLPMIHFDLDKYNLKPEAKASLHHIAQVMKQCPEICVVAVGHTDRLNNNDYNMNLSYNRAKTAVDYLVQVYGISPSRLKINYGGEETPLIDTNGSSYINRRVEFRVCNGEMDMGSPSGTTIDSGSSSGGFQSTGTAPVKY